MPDSAATGRPRGLRARMGQLGPGLIVAAAFVGPGTVTTASVAGADYGFALVWADISMWSGREDLNLDSFRGREACCNYTTSAKPASDEDDTFEV